MFRWHCFHLLAIKGIQCWCCDLATIHYSRSNYIFQLCHNQWNPAVTAAIRSAHGYFMHMSLWYTFQFVFCVWIKTGIISMYWTRFGVCTNIYCISNTTNGTVPPDIQDSKVLIVDSTSCTSAFSETKWLQHCIDLTHEFALFIDRKSIFHDCVFYWSLQWRWHINCSVAHNKINTHIYVCILFAQHVIR